MHSSLPLTPHQITRDHRNWILFSRSPVGKTKYSQRQHRSYKQEVKGQRDHGLRENLKKSLNVYRSPCQSVRDNFSETFIDSTGFITILWQMKRPPANQFMPVLMFPELRALLLQSSDSFSRPCVLLLSLTWPQSASCWLTVPIHTGLLAVLQAVKLSAIGGGGLHRIFLPPRVFCRAAFTHRWELGPKTPPQRLPFTVVQFL